MKIVLAKNIKYDWESVFDVESDGIVSLSDDYIQISEVVDVEFPMIEFDINSRKIELIDKDIKKAEAGIYLLKQAKAELLAIPDMSESK